MIGKRTMAIQNGLFTYGRHRIPLFSGEFHYWRNTAEQWGAIFRALWTMGLRTVRYGRGAVRLAKGGHLGRRVNFLYYRNVPGEPLWLDLNPQAREVLVDVGGRGGTSFRIGYACRVGKG